MEPGESQAAAVVREMREELGVAVEPVRCVWRWDGAGDLTLWGWTAAGPAAEPRPEASEVLWLTPGEVVDHPDAMPSNRDLVAALLGHRSSQP